MVAAEAISAAVKAAVVAFALHFRRERAREHRDVGGGRAGNAGEEHAEDRHHLGQAAAQMPDQVCDSVIMRAVTLADVIRSPTSRKNGTASSASTSMPLKSCAIIEAWLTGVKAVTTSTDGDQREGHRHAHVAEEQKQEAHQDDEHAVGRHSDFARLSCCGAPCRLGKAVAPAVHHLLDGEQRDQNAAQRDGRVQARQRRHRRHAQALEAVEKVQIAEIDHAERHAEHHQRG